MYLGKIYGKPMTGALCVGTSTSHQCPLCHHLDSALHIIRLSTPDYLWYDYWTPKHCM